MPQGVHVSKRPSGHKQRKAKKARNDALKTQAGSIFQYVKRQCTANDSDPHSFDYNHDSMHYLEEQRMDIETAETAEDKSVDIGMSERFEEKKEVETEDDLKDDCSNESDVNHNLKISSDISVWKIPVAVTFRREAIKIGSAAIQNKDGPFCVAKRQDVKAKGGARQLSKEWFYKTMPDGEKILRSWMVYSLVNDHLYCFCCRLFATSITENSSKFLSGFQTWWKLSPKVYNHENSDEHLQCFEKWKTLEAGLQLHKTIDTEAVSLIEIEKKKWRNILQRLLDITLFLAKQNLAFRGHQENEISANKGNFLTMVEMLSKYDTVLKEHLMRLKKSTCKLKASVSYLSPKTQNEFISVLANYMKEKMVADIKSAKYFGIMFDSTPDLSHTDQMSEVIRYVKISHGKVYVNEVFLGFFSLKGKKAPDLSSDILKSLERDGLDIMMCRAQGYDNASSMAGIHGGVQAIIKSQNKKAIFNGCVDHTLNLCGQHSFAENSACVTFFGTLESMYSFFSASSHRWDILIAHTGISVKKLSKTRWSAHHDAVKPVRDKFDEFVAAIEALCVPSENLDTRGAAQGLLPAVCNFTFLCYLYFWYDVLEEVNIAQKYLQIKGLILDKVVKKLDALKQFLQDKREVLAERAIEQAVIKAEEYEISTNKRIRYKKRMAGEKARDSGVSLQEEIKRGMIQYIDRFYCELQTRAKATEEIENMFEAVQIKSLTSASEEELKALLPKLTNFYDEISHSQLLIEIPRLRRHLKAAQIDLEKAKDWSVKDVLSFIAEWNFTESLPNLSLSLRLFLTICVSVASCERSFSKLKLIKNYLRSTMGQSRLLDLAILSIESELAKTIDFDEVVEKFATQKSRKVNF